MIAFGLIASAVCGLLGPIFVPFFIVPEARLAVLGLAESVHSVLVHPGRRHRVPDDLRAVRLPLRDDAAADDHVGGVRRVRPAGRRRHRDVLRRASLLVPSLTSSIFSGQGGQSVVPGIPRVHSHASLRRSYTMPTSIHTRRSRGAGPAALVRRASATGDRHSAIVLLARSGDRASSGSRGGC